MIEFKDDSTFVLSGLPGEAITFTAPPDVSTDESGTWKIIEEESETQRPGVSLTTTGSGMFPDRRRFSLVFDGESNPIRLVSIIGDIDANKKYVLQKASQ